MIHTRTIVNTILIAACVPSQTVVDGSAAEFVFIEIIAGIASAMRYARAVVFTVLIAAAVTNQAVIIRGTAFPVAIESIVRVACAV